MRIVIVALLLLAGCGRSEDPAPKPIPAPVQEAAAAEPAPPPAPEPEPEPETIAVWAGECYGQGTVLWRGKATDIQGNGSDDSQFYDELGGRRVDIDGPHTCVWRYDSDRVRKS